MTAPRVAGSRPSFSLLWFLVGGVALASGCYGGGGAGTDPPPSALYFPSGLAVSKGGNVLYAVNADLDLQWNGGTLQSYDLFLLRHDVDQLIDANLVPGTPPPVIGCKTSTDTGCIPVMATPWQPSDCTNASVPNTPGLVESNGTRFQLGETCAPPVDPTHYQRSSRIIGAFATQLQASPDGTRLFVPVRGSASVTWADVGPDDPRKVPPGDPAANAQMPWTETLVGSRLTTPFDLFCAQDSSGRCSPSNEAGNFIDSHDTRSVTLPGEPFAMALTPDGTAMAVTHQTSTETSLLTAGCDPNPQFLSDEARALTQPTAPTCSPPVSADESRFGGNAPSMQFVMGGMPSGGDGIVAIPHDDSVDSPATGCEYTSPPYTGPCVRPAFLETNHSTAEVDLLRYYSDDGSSLQRPFLVKEVAYTLTAAQGGTDSRGIAIDPTPRLACRAKVGDSDPCPSDPMGAACAQWIACGATPSRVFMASRTPPALIVGQIGGPSASGDGTFDPDRLTWSGTVALAPGPSTVYLAPVVNATGNYELRVFVVCFDASQVFVYDPNMGAVENVINVGVGPFAMAFDPFDLGAVARNDKAPVDGRQVDPTLKAYRFGYLALFTMSYLQVIDLDESLPAVSQYTFENVVFTLGWPSKPKGT